jgi:hypothetical protein
MVFQPMRRDSGATRQYLTAASTTITKQQALVFASGYVTPALATSPEVFVVSNEAITTAAATHKAIKCLNTNAANISFEVLTNITPVQATHVGNKYDLIDGKSINLSFSTYAVFLVTHIKDVANKIVGGFFVKKAT